MSEEALVKIPGTTFSLKFGLKGKYYAVYLVQGKHAVSSKKTSILKGTTLKELPEEIEKGMRFLMDSEEVYISPVIVDRVVNDLLEQIPKDGPASSPSNSERVALVERAWRLAVQKAVEYYGNKGQNRAHSADNSIDQKRFEPAL